MNTTKLHRAIGTGVLWLAILLPALTFPLAAGNIANAQGTEDRAAIEIRQTPLNQLERFLQPIPFGKHEPN